MNDIHSTLNSIGTFVALLGILWIAAVKMTRLEVKVDTMWSMLLKRAVVEGVHRGVLEADSPVRLINNSGAMLEHMVVDLRSFYNQNCKNLSEPDAILQIEKAFGTRLAKEVCIPNNISFGICILIALAVAKNQDTLTEILDDNLGKPKPKE